MIPASRAFQQALKRSHELVVRARAWYPGQPPVEVPVLAGAVTVDTDAECSRTLSMQIPHSFRPSGPFDPIGKNGQRIQLERGIRFPDGSEEAVPLGTFRINSWSKSRLGHIQLEGSSPESVIIGDRLTTPRTVSGPSTVAQILELITEAWPSATILVSATTDGACPATSFEDSRIDAIRTLCKAISVQMITDAWGRFVIRDIPKLGEPVWDVAATTTRPVTVAGLAATDVEPGALLDAVDGESRENIPNSVTARGESLEGDEPPVQATVSVTDPNSPFYAHPDAYGVVRRFYASPLLTTTAQCASAARSILTSQLGKAEQQSCTALVNPALALGDTVNREDADGRLVPVLVHGFTIPLTVAESMPITTRGDGEEYELS